MSTASRSYAFEFGSSMAGYAVLLPVAVMLIQRSPASNWRYAIAMLPVIPLCFALAAMLRFLARMDELARKIQLESFAVAAGVTAIASFAYGMLGIVGVPQMNYVFVAPFIIIVWGLAAAYAGRKYR